MVEERRGYAGGGRIAGNAVQCLPDRLYRRSRFACPLARRGGGRLPGVAVLRAWLLAWLLAGALGAASGVIPAMAADPTRPASGALGIASPAGEPCPLTSPEHTARLVAPDLPGQGGHAGLGEQVGLGEQAGLGKQAGLGEQAGQGAAFASGRVGVPLAVVVALEGPPLPSGVFPVVNIDRAAGPDGGRVSAITGYPESEVRFSAPGRYELDLTVTLVARSSCGGAKARTVLERRVTVRVQP